MNDYLELHALYHHGIKGQKWGVRRFQNEDGTLTPEGKKRYFNTDGSMSEKQMNEFARDWGKSIGNMQAIARKQDPNRRPQSTGKHWDETYKYIGEEVKKYTSGKPSIFDKARSEQDISDIFGEYYTKAALYDYGLSDDEVNSALHALDTTRPRSSKRK